MHRCMRLSPLLSHMIEACKRGQNFSFQDNPFEYIGTTDPSISMTRGRTDLCSERRREGHFQELGPQRVLRFFLSLDAICGCMNMIYNYKQQVLEMVLHLKTVRILGGVYADEYLFGLWSKDYCVWKFWLNCESAPAIARFHHLVCPTNFNFESPLKFYHSFFCNCNSRDKSLEKNVVFGHICHWFGIF